jgi:hypothetical protein
MSVSHQHVKQAWKDKKRGNTSVQITAHALLSEQYYVALFSYVVFILGQYRVLTKRKTNRIKKMDFFPCIPNKLDLLCYSIIYYIYVQVNGTR